MIGKKRTELELMQGLRVPLQACPGGLAVTVFAAHG